MGEAAVRELAEARLAGRRDGAEQGASFRGTSAKDADCRRVAKAVLDKWGRIDALVNSAGTTKFVGARRPRGPVRRGLLGIFRVNLSGRSR